MGFLPLVSKAIGVLQNLITANTTIILTTSHKSKYTIDKWKSIFEARGIIVSDLQCLDNNVEKCYICGVAAHFYCHAFCSQRDIAHCFFAIHLSYCLQYLNLCVLCAFA
jgi:hypothetical protein